MLKDTDCMGADIRPQQTAQTIHACIQQCYGFTLRINYQNFYERKIFRFVQNFASYLIQVTSKTSNFTTKVVFQKGSLPGNCTCLLYLINLQN